MTSLKKEHQEMSYIIQLQSDKAKSLTYFDGRYCSYQGKQCIYLTVEMVQLISYF